MLTENRAMNRRCTKRANPLGSWGRTWDQRLHAAQISFKSTSCCTYYAVLIVLERLNVPQPLATTVEICISDQTVCNLQLFLSRAEVAVLH